MNNDHYFEDLKTQNAYILQGQDNVKEKRAGGSMSGGEIKEELERLLFFKGDVVPSWSDSDCIRFTENLAMVLEKMDQSQLGEMRDLISLLIDGGQG